MQPRLIAAVTAATLALTSLTAATPAAASTDGLVISEYVEGSSFNKAVELFNGTGSDIDLGGLELRLYSNGRPLVDGPTSTYSFPTESLTDGEVWVVTHPSFDASLVPAGTVDATSGAINFNGDDAFTIVDTATGEVVDSFGQVGERFSWAQDVTLRRTDLTRDTMADDSFTTAAYATFAKDDVSDLGSFGDGGGDTDPEPEPEPVCTTLDEDLTRISEVQGPGDFSPLHGQTVTVRAVVTLVSTDLNGFFVQEEAADSDGDPATSEALYVYDPGSAELPSVGDTVELTDRVTSFRDLTQLSFPELEVCDVPSTTIEPTPLTLPADDAARESLEAMVVTTTQDLTVTGLFTAYRYGELGLSLDGVLTQPTAAFHPSDPAAAELAARNAASFLKVNDRDQAFSQFNPYPWESFVEELSAGDTMPAGEVVGPLNFTFGEFKVEPLGWFPEPLDTDTRAEVPTLDGGTDVAAFNVLNYFNTFGDSRALRGATNAEDFALQTAKIVDAITSMDPAVLGLVELENDYEDHYDDDPATVPAIQTLVDALNDATAPGTYAWVVPGEEILTDEDLGGLGSDAIAVGIIYQPARATEVGTPATFDIDSELTGDTEKNRWPLAQTFEVSGVDVTVVVNHLKSKGSSCEDTGSPEFAIGEDVGSDLTGNCNLVRTHAARRLLDWVDTKPTGANTPDTLVVGDLNSYEEEDPIRVFEDADWVDIIERDGDDAFTYKFDGRFGRLDHVLASPSAKRLVTGAAVWQVNSRAPVGYLYDNHPVDDTAFASSDHDPVMVGLAKPGKSKPGKSKDKG